MTHLKHLNKKMWNHVEEQTIFPFNLCRVILENPLFSSPVPLKSCVSSVLFLSGTEELAAEKLLSSPFRHSTLHFFVPRSGQFHFVILIAPYCTVLLISGLHCNCTDIAEQPRIDSKRCILATGLTGIPSRHVKSAIKENHWVGLHQRYG